MTARLYMSNYPEEIEDKILYRKGQQSNGSSPEGESCFDLGHEKHNACSQRPSYKGLEDTSSAAAMSTYCLTAKRVCLYLARAAPQQSIDQLVYAISLRGLEVDYPPGGSGGEAGDDGVRCLLSSSTRPRLIILLLLRAYV